MTDLSDCRWQTVDTQDQSGPENAVVYAFFGSGQSYQCVQWVGGDHYIVQPFMN